MIVSERGCTEEIASEASTAQSSDSIISAASCTTNAIVPVLKLINDKYKITSGHIETVHSYTNDQNLIDNYHSGDRRGRSAALNMVITSTGAVSAVAKAIPELKGVLTGNAIRVPTPNVSLAVMSLMLDQETTKESVNEFLKSHGILVKSFKSGSELKNFLRITIGKLQENNTLLDCIKDYYGKS